MRANPLFMLALGLLIGHAVAAATTLTIHECTGTHGERVFGDPGACSEPARMFALPEPPAPTGPAPVSEAPASRQRAGSRRRSSTARREADSYRCTSGELLWYQHTPCSAPAASHSGAGKQGRGVRQTRVSRTQACREIARPAAVLRKGNEHDERVGPYARATGYDPCR